MNLTDVFPPPPATPPTADERARIERSLRAGLRAETRATARRDRATAIAVPGLVIACLGTIAALAISALVTPSSAPTHTDRPVAASAPAVQVLEAASRHIQRSTPLVPSADQFVYVRSVAITNEGSFGGKVDLGPRHTREIWLSQETTASQDQGLIREFGQDWPWEGSAGSPAGIRRPTYAYLASLPTDPDDLLNELAAQIPAWDDARSAHQVLFDAIIDLVTEDLAPPDTTAALYRALTHIPGVQVDTNARDLLGRPGVGITRTDGVFLDRTIVIIDPSSGETIGARYLTSTPTGDKLFGATAIISRGVADAAGQTPDHVVPAEAKGTAAPA